MTTQPPIYDPNIPQFPGDSFATSQPQLQANFLSLFNSFVKNHIALDALSGSGNHTIVELVEQLKAPQTDVSEISAYAKNVEGQTDQIFLQYQGNGQEFQYTNYQIYSLPFSAFQTRFFTFLPGKILVYFGSFFPTSTANILDLSPYVSKNIITIIFCPISGAAPLYKPNVKLLPLVNGVIQGMEVFSSLGVPVAPPSTYYLVMSNL